MPEHKEVTESSEQGPLSSLETLEILGDQDLMAALRQGIEDVESGKTFSMEEIEREIAR